MDRIDGLTDEVRLELVVAHGHAGQRDSGRGREEEVVPFIKQYETQVLSVLLFFTYVHPSMNQWF